MSIIRNAISYVPEFIRMQHLALRYCFPRVLNPVDACLLAKS